MTDLTSTTQFTNTSLHMQGAACSLLLKQFSEEYDVSVGAA